MACPATLWLAYVARAGAVAEFLVRSVSSAELHCHNIRGVFFAGTTLFSAADDEVALTALLLADPSDPLPPPASNRRASCCVRYACCSFTLTSTALRCADWIM